MPDVLKFIKETPLQTTLILLAIVFFYLALGGKLPGQIQIPTQRHKWAAILGIALLAFGAFLMLMAPGEAREQLAQQLESLTTEHQALQEKHANLQDNYAALVAERDELQEKNRSLQAIIDAQPPREKLMLIVRQMNERMSIIRDVKVEIGGTLFDRPIDPQGGKFLLPLEDLEDGFIYITVEPSTFIDRQEFTLRYQPQEQRIEIFVYDNRGNL
ncbi:hypothetical protein GF339_07930 [candidate division KSB3 bacterium]|uniref:Uncharacterized protein n=1 Tax=candidate division KSB3 bacterium TaxID=2044937 RepID=A0A9D5JUR0_9BACT|nr:hypothetical protein [candidate division KSB3 bacterium]MBD3324498.1 hypothetical protein [candidate division KSB3 bacterium]